MSPLKKESTSRHFPRWSVVKIMDLLYAAANVKAWSSPHGDVAVNSLVGRVNEMLREISDTSMP